MTTLLELESFMQLIGSCEDPEDLFGPLLPENGDRLKQLKANYTKAANICHPDRFVGQEAGAQLMAEETFKRLQRLHEIAKDKIKKGTYGTPGVHSTSGASSTPTTLKTRKRTYTILSHLADGDYSSVYLGEYEEKGDKRQVAIKIVADAADNDLMTVEQHALSLLHHKHIPVLVETFRTTDGFSATVLEYIDGYDLTTIRQRYPSGIPQVHAAWIFQRLLSGLGFIHEHGVFHGNLTPDNILVRPRDHNAFIIDFLCSVINPGSDDSFIAATDLYTAPEAYKGLPPIEASDLYSLGKCIIYLLGGDTRTNSLPNTVDPRFARFILSFVEKDPNKRPQSAYKAWHELTALRDTVFGARRQFLEFVV